MIVFSSNQQELRLGPAASAKFQMKAFQGLTEQDIPTTTTKQQILLTFLYFYIHAVNDYIRFQGMATYLFIKPFEWYLGG